MNKRQAKREACWIVALWAQDNLDAGCTHGHFEFDEQLTPNDADIARVELAITAVIAELTRRSW